MSSRRANTCLIAAFLLSGGLSPLSALAADKPAPTFLESGGNDLIRLQRGEVPQFEAEETDASSAGITLEDRLEADTAEETKNERRVDPEAALGRLLSEVKPSRDRAFAPSQQQAGEAEPVQKPAPPVVQEPNIQSLSDSVPAPAEVIAPQVPSALQAPPTPAPALLDKDIEARLVTVCLSNPQEASGTKAFDIRRAGPPRYVAEIGATACARFEPTRHTLYLWKTDARGDLSLILSSRLDLNDADGTQVSLDWLRDR